MTETMKAILKQIIEDYNLDCKRINPNSLELAGTKMAYGNPHNIYYYSIKKTNTKIYFEYDVYRNIAREVMVF